MLTELFGRIFSSKNYLLYSNLNSAAYMSIVRSLQNAGIAFRTVTRYNAAQPLKTQRDIYIKEADKDLLRVTHSPSNPVRMSL